MSESENQKQKRRRRYGCGGYLRDAKKLLIRCGKKKPTESCGGDANGGISGKSKIFGVDICCCFKQPSTLESSVESVTSDPNDSKFTFEMLRGFIETNDFYSKECNLHLDLPSSSFLNDGS
ncbi:hypothetical protein M5689_008592 [Euphorbia peplus]|nr:hypothetical protein M5689_008592 [Euphorbia peplus]